MLIKSYIEPNTSPIPNLRLPDKEYADAIQCLVFGCSDIIPINKSKRVVYLSKRISKPAPGWWFIGGRMQINDNPLQAAARNFERETSLKLPLERFQLNAIFDYLWKDREQEPQNIGCHGIAFTFTVELSDEELAIAGNHLDQKEFQANEGLTEFDREKLIAENVYPSILDLYDQIFPKET